jgi:MarR family transcriptional regulator, organic hydroperoxide resistance regulator
MSTPDAAAEVPDTLQLESQVCFALSVAARNVVAVYRPFLEPMGLTHPQYLVMLALWQHGPSSVKRLSALLQLDPGTLSPLVKRLEQAGLVRRDRDPRDERSLAIALTEEGRALRARAQRIPAGIVERLGMDLAELTALHGALTRVIGASRSALDPGEGDPSHGRLVPQPLGPWDSRRQARGHHEETRA